MDDETRMAAIVRPFSTVSDQIRALNAEGHRRADIARFLGKRYQHVRNVLVEDERRGRAGATRGVELDGGLAESRTPAWSDPLLQQSNEGSAILRLKMSDGGAIGLPSAVVSLLGLRPGGTIVAELLEDRLVLLSGAAALKRAQDMVKALIPGDDSLADSLIADRRREARVGQDV